MAHRVSLGTGVPFTSGLAWAALPSIQPRPARLPRGPLLPSPPGGAVGWGGVSLWPLAAGEARRTRFALSEKEGAL